MIGRNPLTLSEEHKTTLDRLEYSEQHFFITGRAGTGKSTLLQLFKKTTKKRIVVLAPTGIAALNVGGQTIHSFFGFPPRLMMPSEITKHRNSRLFKNLDAIVIDEISMVRAEMMDNIDAALRINRNINLPFGGIQMIFFGDLFQLPPVISTSVEKEFLQKNFASPYFFSARIFEHHTSFEMIELTKVYRQEERGFINLLDNIRLKEIDEYDLEELNSRFVQTIDESNRNITLSSRNIIANEINRRKLIQLDSLEEVYLAEVTGSFPVNLFPTEITLKLKVGAQVMFIKNDIERQFVNGTIGIVHSLSQNELLVESVDNEGKVIKINVPKTTWEIIKYKVEDQKITTEVIGSFTQYPLKLAWGITIHKSQGKTFDNVIIDLGKGAFEYGQTYVALSRCRTFEGIQLKQPIRPSDILVDDRIIDFYYHKKRYT